MFIQELTTEIPGIKIDLTAPFYVTLVDDDPESLRVCNCKIGSSKDVGSSNSADDGMFSSSSSLPSDSESEYAPLVSGDLSSSVPVRPAEDLPKSLPFVSAAASSSSVPRPTAKDLPKPLRFVSASALRSSVPRRPAKDLPKSLPLCPVEDSQKREDSTPKKSYSLPFSPGFDPFSIVSAKTKAKFDRIMDDYLSIASLRDTVEDRQRFVGMFFSEYDLNR